MILKNICKCIRVMDAFIFACDTVMIILLIAAQDAF